MSQKKIIRSHRERVKTANEYRKRSNKKISIIDREAIVEFYLLEDIKTLYESDLKDEERQVPTDALDTAMHLRLMEQYKGLLNIFNAAISVSRVAIKTCNYSIVWSSIPEHALMATAGKIQYLDKIKEIASKMLKRIFEDTIKIAKTDAEMKGIINDAIIHDANLRRVTGLAAIDDSQVADAIVSPSVTASENPEIEFSSGNILDVDSIGSKNVPKSKLN